MNSDISKTQKFLWLDDIRNPTFTQWMALILKHYPDINMNPETQIYWVKSYDEFVNWIEFNGLPYHIFFDHDLADEHYKHGEKYNFEKFDYSKVKEKTGFDCAKWLVEYCMNNSLELPKYTCHSFNPCGRENILSYLKSFENSELPCHK